MKELNQILEKYKCPRRKDATKTSFEEIEDIIRFRLPEDYKAYILSFGGFAGAIGKEYLQLWDFDDLIGKATLTIS